MSGHKRQAGTETNPIFYGAYSSILLTSIREQRICKSPAALVEPALIEGEPSGMSTTYSSEIDTSGTDIGSKAEILAKDEVFRCTKRSNFSLLHLTP